MKFRQKINSLKLYRITANSVPVLIVGNLISVVFLLLFHDKPHAFLIEIIGIVLLLNSVILLMINLFRHTFLKNFKNKLSDPVIKIRTDLDKLVNDNSDISYIINDISDLDSIKLTLESIGDTLESYHNEKQKNEADKLIYINGLMHDLATPITRINGFASMINDGIVSDIDEIRKFTEMIVQNTEDISIMLKNLAEIEKYDKAIIRNHMIPVNVSTLLERYIDDLSLELSQSNVRISFEDRCSFEPVCMMDVKSCKRVLMNIISNSIKYSKPDSDCVIKVTLDNLQKGFATVSISDNGIGIDADSIDNIFDLFYRGDVTRHNISEGNGLGLYISREIILSHSGRIYAESNSDGLTVYISLPVTDEQAVEWY